MHIRAPRRPALTGDVADADGARMCMAWAATSGRRVKWATEVPLSASGAEHLFDHTGQI
jgi:hypothetical protein